MFGRRANEETAPSPKGKNEPQKAVAVKRSAETAPTIEAKPEQIAKKPDQKFPEITIAKIQSQLYEKIDASAANKLPRHELTRQITSLIGEIVFENRMSLTTVEQTALAEAVVDDMVGLGPLEFLLKNDAITDIMVNGPMMVYAEISGKLQLTDIKFRNAAHVLNIAQRIVTKVGRRVDETSPICDARLEDGSRVNVIAPPLAIDGCSISIRKFSKKSITLDSMTEYQSMSPELSQLLKVASACRLNIVVSGGTGSGKTTMLNAMSKLIDANERVVTIEDAAELQLQQPHVVRLETRPPNLEGQGEVTMRDLVKNALRMRPDRIICGEVRGPETIDMLQAMNTGHDGSMCTLHSNNPREAVTRMENMILMGSSALPQKAIRSQIAGAVNLVIQVSRMRDGGRRVTHVTEIVGMEGDIITTQDLFTYEYEGEGRDGRLIGRFVCHSAKPKFTKRAAYFGLEETLLKCLQGAAL